ncbi:MAG: mechanosensitive ion channel domain-containing protein [Byssovorax sp.]
MDPTAVKDLNVVDMIRVSGVISGAVALFVTWFVVRLLTGVFTRLGNQFAHRRLALNQVATLTRFVMYLGGIAVAAGLAVNLSKEVVLALTGTAAVTIGFALKDLAASVLAGIIIIIDRPFQVGDRVTFGGTYGEISAIGLRSVRLVTLDDNVVTIPNNKFLTDMVSSGNWGALDMLIQMDFFVGVDQDVASAKRLVEECLISNRYVYLQKPWVVLVNQVIQGEYFAVRLRAKAYVLDVQYEKAFETDVTERVIEAFREHGVLPPAVLHRRVAAAALGASVGVPAPA